MTIIVSVIVVVVQCRVKRANGWPIRVDRVSVVEIRGEKTSGNKRAVIQLVSDLT